MLFFSFFNGTVNLKPLQFFMFHDIIFMISFFVFFIDLMYIFFKYKKNYIILLIIYLIILINYIKILIIYLIILICFIIILIKYIIILVIFNMHCEKVSMIIELIKKLEGFTSKTKLKKLSCKIILFLFFYFFSKTS